MGKAPAGGDRRTLDAVAVSLWPSKGLRIDGFEVKCSRADWRRELRAPEKAGEFLPMIDRMWVVAADRAIVPVAELPDRWGLMVPHGAGLTVVREAFDLHGIVSHGYAANAHALPPGFSRGFLASLLREVQRNGGLRDA